MTPHPLAVGWTLLVALGILYTASCVVEALKDRHALAALGRNGSSRLLANGTLRTERVLLVVQVLFLAGGLFVPPTSRGWAVAACFVAAEVLLVWDSSRRKAGRRRLLEVLAAEDQRIRIAEATHGQIGGLRDEDPAAATATDIGSQIEP